MLKLAPEAGKQLVGSPRGKQKIESGRREQATRTEAEAEAEEEAPLFGQFRRPSCSFEAH